MGPRSDSVVFTETEAPAGAGVSAGAGAAGAAVVVPAPEPPQAATSEVPAITRVSRVRVRSGVVGMRSSWRGPGWAVTGDTQAGGRPVRGNPVIAPPAGRA